MIEKLKRYIKEDDVENFKIEFQSSINHHHRLLLAELSYRNQSENIFKFMQERVTITKEEKITFFEKLLIDGNKIKDFNILAEFSDMELQKAMHSNVVNFISKNDEEKVCNFFVTHPLVAYVNINKIFYCGMKYGKEKLLEHYEKETLEPETIFYFGLCSQRYCCEDKFEKLISTALNYNGNVIKDLTEIKFKHLKNIRGYKWEERRDEFNSFITEATINAFSKHLDSVLKKKESEPLIKKQKFKV